MNHSFRGYALGRGLCYRKGSGFRAIRDMSALAISDASIAISTPFVGDFFTGRSRSGGHIMKSLSYMVSSDHRVAGSED